MRVKGQASPEIDTINGLLSKSFTQLLYTCDSDSHTLIKPCNVIIVIIKIIVSYNRSILNLMHKQSVVLHVNDFSLLSWDAGTPDSHVNWTPHGIRIMPQVVNGGC